MNNLYNELVSGSTEYRDNGEVIRHPPSPVMLKAARAIQELVGINSTNNNLIQQLQWREQESMQAEQRYHDQLAYLEEVIRSLSKQLKEQNESLCKSEREVSSMGMLERADTSASDSSSEGSITDPNDGLGTN